MKNHGDKPALGWRPMMDGKAGPYEWMTYSQVQGRLPVMLCMCLLQPRTPITCCAGTVVLHAHVIKGTLCWDCREGQGYWLRHPGQRCQAKE